MAKYVKKLLDLSTAHLTREVAEQLMSGSIPMPVSCKQDEYGFFIAVLPASLGRDDRYPDCIRRAINHARIHGADFINYDRDAEKIDELPSYDW